MSSGLCTIVGAGPSLGMAVARRFAREGFRIALLARRRGALDEYVAQLSDRGTQAYGYVADAADLDSLSQAFEQLHGQLGQVDVLVYNAGIARAIQPAELDVETLVDDFRVNVAGALASAQQVIPYMRERHRGTIIFTGGGMALHPYAQYASLAIGKAGLRCLAFTLGEELEAEGVHVATVTIAGPVQPGTRFDPDRIADCYWALHGQDPVRWQREVIYQ